MRQTQLVLNKYSDPLALANALADKIVEALCKGIENKGQAILAVSGGSTPKNLFQTLSGKKIPWNKIIVTLVDERCVPADHPRSNAQLINEFLRVNEAAVSKFLPLYHDLHEKDFVIDAAEKSVAGLPYPIDAAILGMGSDGHTASFFPGADNLAQATDPDNQQRLSAIRAKGALEPRVTFNLSTLVNADFLALHIEGNDKLSVLRQAQNSGEANTLPIRHILRAAPHLEIFWAP